MIANILFPLSPSQAFIFLIFFLSSSDFAHIRMWLCFGDAPWIKLAQVKSVFETVIVLQIYV